MNTEYNVVVVGGGASGLLCAGLLAESGISVLLCEKNNKIGKKLAATGNGRCNFTNYDLNTECYYGDKSWIGQLIQRYPTKAIVKQFEELGIYSREKDGYVYPHTNQASTVVDALHLFCKEHGVDILTDCRVSNIEIDKRHSGYVVRAGGTSVYCHYVVLSTGGKAGKELGGDGNGYQLAKCLGHTISPIYAGLTGLKCEGDWWKAVAGTRVQGRFSLVCGGERYEGECGEIQIVKNGVSGIPVFQLCRIADEKICSGNPVYGEIDFVPPMNEDELSVWVSEHGIDGLVPAKWKSVLEKRKHRLKNLKHFSFVIQETFGLERAQVSAGGIPVGEVRVETMESKISPGLYLTGEIIDIDGKCGGYNLHFAWSTAMAVSKAIINKKE